MFVYRRDPDALLGAGVAFTSAALDLGDGQSVAAREAAFGLVSSALGAPVAIVAQVHGTAVVRIDAPGTADGLIDLTGHRADALVATVPGVAVAVRVADCVPVCVAAADGSAVAAVHAGREGLLAGVIDAALAEMRRVSGADLRAWIGPHVCGGCYEVPDAMAREAADKLGVPVSRTRRDTLGIDLGGAARRQLEASGVAVTRVGGCTLEDTLLHSHRGGSSGRMAGIAWLG
ncbi:MAG: polyphenol oxidase family protein [Nigerium sp.]|nr:polyphenol oxidase family protein [Nigerium sp.]